MLELFLYAAYGWKDAFWILSILGLYIPCALLLRKEKIVVVFLRSVLIALLVLALADPREVETSSKDQLSAIIDVSSSMSTKAIKGSLDTLKKFQEELPESTISLIPFASKVGQPIELEGDWSVSQIQREVESSRDELDAGDSNLEAALWSAESLGKGASTLVLSDGFETLGSSREAAQALSARGLRVFPLVPDEKMFLQSELALESVYAPLTLSSGDRTNLRVAVKNSFSKPKEGTVEIWLDNKKLESQEVSVEPGKEELLVVKTPALKGGLKRVRSVLKVEGEEPQELHRWISVKERTKVLLLNGTEEDARVLPEILKFKGYVLDNRILDGTERAPVELENYSTVILNNAARKQLPKTFLPKLESFTKNGGGLILIGGDRSYGLGGYKDTLLEEISPLKFIPPRSKPKRLVSGVVLVLDKSRSMAYQGKIHAAKLAALSSISALKDNDQVGVIGFDRVPFVIIPLARVSEVKPRAERRLRNLTAAGETNLWPALGAARQALRKSNVSRKHIIVLSDGKIPLGRNDYTNEIKRARKEGITISAVALGAEADLPFMKMMAQYGKGAFYHTLDPSRLPQIFKKDIQVSVGEDTMKEREDFPVQVGPAGLQSVRNRGRLPYLRGFVETRPKRGSELELITQKNRKVYPILSSWTYQKGKVAAFTSDANGRWSTPWLKQWNTFINFWGDLMISVRPKMGEKAKEVDFDLRYSANGKELALDLAIFDETLRTKAAPSIQAIVDHPGGERETIIFQPMAKGRFQGIIKNSRPGDFTLNLNYGAVRFPKMGITLSGDIFGEQVGQGINLRTLSEVAYATGGVLNPQANRLKGIKRISEESRRLFHYPLILAFALLILEAILRETQFSAFFKRNRPQASGRTVGNYGPRRKAA